MNLAAHDGKIYRVGGMQPRNAPGEPADSHSIADAASFDPVAGRWTSLPPLPQPRSSHDAVVVGDTLLVIGGWQQRGVGVEPEWPETMEAMDLSSQDRRWESLPQPFSRRALIVTALGDQVFVIGGFDAEDTPQPDVDIYTTSSKAWSKGPPIPGKRRNGFSPAACTHDRSVYLGVGTGEMFRLTPDQGAWELFSRTTPRVVHRMIPSGPEVLLLGGATETRMLDLVEAVRVGSAR